MNRRQYLLGAATGFAALAGCAGNQSGSDGTQSTTSRSGGQSATRTVVTETARNGGRGTTTTAPTTTATNESLRLTSTAFDDTETIPRRFTCGGANISPPLAVGDVSATVEAVALVVDDPDAGTQPFTHWLLWNLPPTVTELPVSVPDTGTVSSLGGALQGTNDAGGIGYTGPCPPESDGPHTYRFALSALGSALDVEAGAERAAVDEAINGTEIARTLLRGTFERG